MAKGKKTIEGRLRLLCKDRGHTFLKVNWNKGRLHYLTASGGKGITGIY